MCYLLEASQYFHGRVKITNTPAVMSEAKYTGQYCFSVIMSWLSDDQLRYPCAHLKGITNIGLLH